VTVGTLVFAGLTELLVQAQTILNVTYNIPTMYLDFNALEPILLGALLIIILMIRPQGLIPEKSTLTISKSRLRKIVEELKKSPVDTG
jgi:branched-chain amino acid transport system permease protein